MYICNDCGAVFTNPKIFYERHGLENPPFEEWHVCPSCESTNIDLYYGSDEID